MKDKTQNYPSIAYSRIAAFGKRFGDAHLYLAYHAAYPLALTPDLLYRLWANFQQDIRHIPLNIPWVAVNDLLLSSLCSEVSYELYEMDPTIRKTLLKSLKSEFRFGELRIKQLSDFILDYVKRQMNSSDPHMRDLAQVQRWTVLAYTKPDVAAQKLALALRQSYSVGINETVRIASIIETFDEVLEGYQPLLSYARGIASVYRGNLEDGWRMLGELTGRGDNIRIAGVNLPVPNELISMLKERRSNPAQSINKDDVQFASQLPVAKLNRLMEAAALAFYRNEWQLAIKALSELQIMLPESVNIHQWLLFAKHKLDPSRNERPDVLLGNINEDMGYSKLVSTIKKDISSDTRGIGRESANITKNHVSSDRDAGKYQGAADNKPYNSYIDRHNIISTSQGQFLKPLELTDIGLSEAELEHLNKEIEAKDANQVAKQFIERKAFTQALYVLEKRLSQEPADNDAKIIVAGIIESPDALLRHRIYAANMAARFGDVRPGVLTLEPYWCSTFPEADYTLSDYTIPFHLNGFRIARYPITVWQYSQFIQDSGYRDERWWTPQGWSWLSSGGLQHRRGSAYRVERPGRWGDPYWTMSNQPIVGVSWYEAMAFCSWLTERGRAIGWLKADELIRLPSEAEWEVAAGWDVRTGQMHKWYIDDNKNVRQNVGDVGIGRSSSVGLFPEGVSPCGALDMAGNVWEWCRSHDRDYPLSAERLQTDFLLGDWGAVLRGSSFGSRNPYSGWNARFVFGAAFQLVYFGFRVCIGQLE